MEIGQRIRRSERQQKYKRREKKKEKQIKILMGHKDPIGCTNHIPIQNLIRMGNNLVCGVIWLHLVPAFHSEATDEAKWYQNDTLF